MLKNIIISLLLVNCTYGFTSNMQLFSNDKKCKPAINLKRRDCFKYIPFIISPLFISPACAEEKSIDVLREEANRIIEIIDAQKEAFNLPELGKKDNIENGSKNTSEIYKNEDKQIKQVLDNVLTSFKNNNPIDSMENLKLYCAQSNPIKSQRTDKLIETFNNSKYGILLAKFHDYSILDYNDNYYFDTDFNISYYSADVKVEADYKTMIYNSIQFNDMYYPESNNNNNNMCYVIYRWVFKKIDEKVLIDSCYLLPK